MEVAVHIQHQPTREGRKTAVSSGEARICHDRYGAESQDVIPSSVIEMIAILLSHSGPKVTYLQYIRQEGWRDG